MPNPPLAQLTRTECDALLRSARFGRVVYTDRALPACTPVNYAVDGQSIVFRTTAGSRLAKATDHEVVAFEVDDIDDLTESGWTVVVTGNAMPITGISELVRVAQLGLSAWPDGQREHWIRLSPGIVSGRRLTAAAAS